MRKAVGFLLCGALVAPALCAFAGCGGGGGRRSAYAIRAEYFPEERKLACEMTAEIVNNTDNALEELHFALWPNAYKEGAEQIVSDVYYPAAYYNGASYGGVEVSAVQGAKSFSVCGQDDTSLVAALSSPLYPDEKVKLEFSFEVTLAEVNHRLGVGENAVNLANFYPVLTWYGEEGFCDYPYAKYGDPFVSECADYDVVLTVPGEYTVCGAAKGAETDGKTTWTLQAENVRDVAFVLGTKYQSVQELVGEIPVTYYYLTDETPERTLGVAASSLAYYAETFGEYAYPQYTVVETDFPYGGMEFPMLSMIACGLHERETVLVAAHETAHQWWYAMVGSNQFEEAWLDEGLAEYSTALFLGAHPEYEGGYADMVSASEAAYRAFFSVQSQISGEADTRMTRPLTEFKSEYEYRNVVYDKGVILFDTLRTVAKDRRFFSALKDYFARYRGEIASGADMVACFHRAGARVEEVVASFTDGKCVI